ncbi:MAG: methyl-accepting chemotaxis protein [Clostridium sp.]|uniref:methyl-accepting chemotaxis protein n=1 Tax=Clostridium sp. TaxID=1506 RepID=UPI003EE45F11
MSVNFDFDRKKSVKTKISSRVGIIFFITFLITITLYTFIIKGIISNELSILNIDSNSIFNRVDFELFLLGAVLITISVCIVTYLTYKTLEPLARLLNNFRIHFEFLAEGDYFYRIKEKHFYREDELGPISKAVDEMQVSTMDLIKEITDNSSCMTKQSEKLTSLSNDLKDFTTNISKSIIDISNNLNVETFDIISVASEIDKFREHIEHNMHDINEISLITSNMDKKALASSKEMESLNQSFVHFNSIFTDFLTVIKEMKTKMEQVTEITGIINQIAEQTNLLSLNAAIEAARAGDAGRGFSVVSNEIRNLSIQTKESSININHLISTVLQSSNELFTKTFDLSENLENQKKIIKKSLSTFEEISDSVKIVNPKVDKLKASSDLVVKNNNIILDKINSISKSANQISLFADDISSSTNKLINSSNTVHKSAISLNNMADVSLKAISKFKLQDEYGNTNRNEGK